MWRWRGKCFSADRGAQVSGLDAAENLISLARERVLDGDFRVGDIEELPFEDNVFDAVFASNSIQYSGNRIATLREFGRVCSANGRIAAGLFGPPEKVKYSAVFKALRDAMPEPPHGGGPFELSVPGKLEGLFEEAGLKVIDNGEVNCPFGYSDFELFWQANASAGPVQNILQSVPEDDLRKVLNDAIKEFINPNGEILINPNVFKYVVATK